METSSSGLKDYPVSIVLDGALTAFGGVVLYALLAMLGVGSAFVDFEYLSLDPEEMLMLPAAYVLVVGVTMMAPWGLVLGPCMVYLFHQFLYGEQSKWRLGFWVFVTHAAAGVLARAAMEGPYRDPSWLPYVQGFVDALL
jgi:hypothetical protein